MADADRQPYVPGDTSERMTHIAYDSPKLFNLTSMLSSAAYIILTYLVTAIIAAYVVIQAAEAFSLTLNPNFGICWKLLWISYMFVAGVFGFVMLYALHNMPGGPVLIQNPQLGWL
ncbi:hypothetical protein DE146DRAFT_627867 [Phaeosphaeria sp. MPI-PUGE-AT-0046c]|nr:hypothetical protein DE146DRAFT_627867 [Phaeosphaeria sp. MPI-PUGE-AT-0046c]